MATASTHPDSIGQIVCDGAPGALIRLAELASDTYALHLLTQEVGNENLHLVAAILGWQAFTRGPAVTLIYAIAPSMSAHAKGTAENPERAGQIFRYSAKLILPLWLYSVSAGLLSGLLSSSNADTRDTVFYYNLIYALSAMPCLIMISLLQRTYTALNKSWHATAATLLHRAGFILLFLAFLNDKNNISAYSKMALAYTASSAIACIAWLAFTYLCMPSLTEYRLFSGKALIDKTKKTLRSSGLCSFTYSLSELGKYTFTTAMASLHSNSGAAQTGLLVQWLLIADGTSYGLSQVLGQRYRTHIKSSHASTYAIASACFNLALAAIFSIFIGTCTTGMIKLIAENTQSTTISSAADLLSSEFAWITFPCVVRNASMGPIFALNSKLGNGLNINITATAINIFFVALVYMTWVARHQQPKAIASAMATSTWLVAISTGLFGCYLHYHRNHSASILAAKSSWLFKPATDEATSLKSPTSDTPGASPPPPPPPGRATQQHQV